MLSEIADIISWRTIVAHSKVLRNITSNVLQTLGRTVRNITSNSSRSAPNDLRKVPERSELAHVWLRTIVRRKISISLAVIPEYGDGGCDIVCFQTSCDVLSIAASADGSVVLEIATLG